MECNPKNIIHISCDHQHRRGGGNLAYIPQLNTCKKNWIIIAFYWRVCGSIYQEGAVIFAFVFFVVVALVVFVLFLLCFFAVVAFAVLVLLGCCRFCCFGFYILYYFCCNFRENGQTLSQ